MKRLEEIIKSQIRDKKRITFAEFMELALYHPSYGYYSSGRADIGKQGDFYTSPLVHSSFGRIVGNFILKALDQLVDNKLSIIELGAGKGFLSVDILNHIRAQNENIYNGLTYYIVERNKYSETESMAVLGDHAHKTKWISELKDIEDREITGVVLSNELFDALPFHRLKIENGTAKEIYVTLDEREFIEVLDSPSSNDLESYLSKTDVEFRESQEFEINLNSKKLLSEIDEVLNQGFILTIDYGYLTSELFAQERMKGTYKCLHKHQINEKPFINIGEQDITAHVDFSNLIREGEALGLNKLLYTTQAQFLIDWGILEYIENIQNETDKDLEKEIQAIKNLFLPELMGDKFKVLIQEKMESNLSDFYPDSPFRISFNIL